VLLPEPQHPDPKTFDLTSERLAEVENAHGWISTRLLGVVFVLILLSMVSEASTRHGLTFSVESLLALLFLGFIALVVSFSIAFLVALPAGMILGALWTRMQPDYARLRLYQRAVEQYKVEYAAWLKTQRSWWERLHPQRFEQEVAAFFKKQGHRVE